MQEDSSQQATTIHSSVVVDEDVHVGEGTAIWHFSHLSSGCRVGKGCVLGQNIFVGKQVTIGDRVKIQNNVSVFSGVALHEDVFVGPSVVFTNVLNPRATIERKNSFVPTIVERGATIGANSTIICGNRIGAFALIGAGTVVTQPVEPYSLVLGNPGRHVGWVDQEGNRVKNKPSVK